MVGWECVSVMYMDMVCGPHVYNRDGWSCHAKSGPGGPLFAAINGPGCQ